MTEAQEDAVRRATVLISLGRFAEAAVVARAELAREPGNWRAATVLADAELRQNHLKEARTAAERAVSLAPDQEWTHRALAVVLTRLGQGPAARHEALEAVRLAPESSRAYVALVSALLLVRDLSGAQAAAERAAALAPSEAAPFVQMSVAAITAEDWQLAERMSLEALARDPENVAAYNNLGVSLLRQRRREDAIAALEQAARLDPSHPVVRKTLYRLRHSKSATYMTQATRTLASDQARARRTQPHRWDWKRLTMFRPWWWRGVEAIPPAPAFVLHVLAVAALILGIATAPNSLFVILLIWLILMLPRSYHRVSVWWALRFPGRDSWIHAESTGSPNLAASETGDG